MLSVPLPSFFEGKIVVDRGHIAEEVKAAVAEGTTAGLEMLGDQDAIHLLDRIGSFSADKRIVGTTGYVMGLWRPHWTTGPPTATRADENRAKSAPR